MIGSFAVWSLIPLEQDETYLTGQSLTRLRPVLHLLTKDLLRRFQLPSFSGAVGERRWIECREYANHCQDVCYAPAEGPYRSLTW